jgi:hypothetical protein
MIALFVYTRDLRPVDCSLGKLLRTAPAWLVVLAAIHSGTSAATAGSPAATSLSASEDLPANINCSVFGRVVDVAGNPLAFVSVGLSPTAINKDDYYMNDVVQRTITDADSRFAMPPKDLQLGVYYRTRRGGDGGPIPARVGQGVYRVNQGLLPGRDTDVRVRAPGFKSMMTKPFQFTEEGQQGVVEYSDSRRHSAGAGRARANRAPGGVRTIYREALWAAVRCRSRKSARGGCRSWRIGGSV